MTLSTQGSQVRKVLSKTDWEGSEKEEGEKETDTHFVWGGGGESVLCRTVYFFSIMFDSYGYGPEDFILFFIFKI